MKVRILTCINVLLIHVNSFLPYLLKGVQGAKEISEFECPAATDYSYVIASNKCFHFLHSSKTFVEAKEYCQSKSINQQGKIYEPKTTNHMDLIHKIYKKRGGTNYSYCFWLGIDDASTEGIVIGI